MVLDSIGQIEDFKRETADNKSVFLYPVLKDDRLHKHKNPIVGFIIIQISTRKIYTISNGHPEGVFNYDSLDYLDGYEVYCYDTAAFRYAGYDTSKYIDVMMQYYLYTNTGYESTQAPIISHYTRQYQQCHKVNELISFYKHQEIALTIMEESWVKNVQPGLSFYQQDLVDAFYNIEKNGLSIDTEKFNTRFGETFSKDGDRSYTQYNYYTTTGRPSNRFGGINFAALNKDDETREAFIAREGYTLVELDFNSYHPRLIAQLVGYDFGTDNVYEHLAKHYSNSDNPTQDQIDAAKEATFRQMYGGIHQQYLHIPFFAKVNDLARYLWKKMEDEDYIESPISGRRLVMANYQDITVYTLFNYFIQMYETESNVIVLTKIHELLKDKETKPILYTYDSILFEVKNQELDFLLETVIPKAIDIEKFPVKIKKGNSYGSLRV